MSVTTRDTGRARVTFWTGPDHNTPVIVDGEVLAFQTSRQAGAPAGSWALTLAAREEPGHAQGSERRLLELYGRQRPNDLVSIGYRRDGGILMGLVDRFTERATFAGNQLRRTYQVTGSCLGRVLASDAIVVANMHTPATADFLDKAAAVLGTDHPLTKWVQGVWGPTVGEGEEAAATFTGATVKAAAEWILSHCATLRLPHFAAVFGGTGEVGDWMQVEATTWGDARIYSSGWSAFQGTLWAYINGLLDNDFYEIRVDYRPQDPVTAKGDPRICIPVLVIRPKPLDEGILKRVEVPDSTGLDWGELTTWLDGKPAHVIPESSVYSYELGCDATDAFSFYSVTSQLALPGSVAGADEGLAYPALDLFNAVQYGQKAYRAALNLLSPDLILKADNEVDPDKLWTEIRVFRNRLINWHWANARFERGSITIIGDESIRVGDPVELPWKYPPMPRGDVNARPGMRYYCTGVSHSWSAGGSFTTTLQLTRGHNDGLIAAEKQIIAAKADPANPTMMCES